MKNETWLKSAIKKLETAEIGTARLDAFVLLEFVSGKDRGWLLAHPEFELTNSQVNSLNKLVKRRVKHEPLAQIRGKTEFYGREFTINKSVLEPRPESEAMIDLLKKLALTKVSIFDVGTGSGALAITAKLGLPDAQVSAIDIDKNCLVVAKKNASKLGAKVSFYHSNLLNAVPKKLLAGSIILANLPYVPESFRINPAAMNEPKLAIFGGPDGLDIYRQLFKQVNELTLKPSYVLTESLPPQHEKLMAIAEVSGYRLAQVEDFIQVFELT